jgi:ArsR family transcriptional regulator
MKLIQEIDVACCPPLLRAPLGEAEADRLASALRVLADPARLRVVSLIASSEGGETCVCELVDQLDLSQPTVSHHLRVLLDAGLLERERRGRWAFYRLRPEPLELLRSALAAPSSPAPETNILGSRMPSAV